MSDEVVFRCRGCGRFYLHDEMDTRADGRMFVPPCVWTTCQGAGVTPYIPEEEIRGLSHQSYVAALLQLALERVGFHLPPSLRVFQHDHPAGAKAGWTRPEHGSPEMASLHDAVEEAKDGILSLLCGGTGKVRLGR